VKSGERIVQNEEKASYLILGCGVEGAFARIAVDGLREKAKDILLVDIDSGAISLCEDLGVRTHLSDGIETVIKMFEEEALNFDWIIPNIPLHLVFEVVIRIIGKDRKVNRIPVPLMELFPNPFLGKHGEIFASLADFTCPQDCGGPSPVCPKTGRAWAKPLYELLSDLNFEGYDHFVLRSYQLAPGAGGIKAKDLAVLLALVNTKGRSIITTACDCHSMTAAMEAEDIEN
jgi:hypothetical protein